MVQPFNYVIPQADPFAGVLQGLKLGASMQQMEAAREQRAAQTDALRQKLAMEQKAVERAAANEAELQQLQAVPFEGMTRQQQLRLLQLTESEASRAFIARELERTPVEVVESGLRRAGSIVNALRMNPEIGIKRLRESAEVEKNPDKKKAYDDAASIAEQNPLLAARMIHGYMDSVAASNEKFRRVPDAVVNFLDRAGAPLYPKEPGKPMVVAPGASVFQPGSTTAMFTAPAAPETKTPTQKDYERAVEQGFKGTIFDYQRQLAEAKRPPPQPREPREPPAPIPVVDPATGQVKYVPRDQAVGMTPPQFMEGLTPKERQKREALFPKAKQAVATVETTMGDLVADLENLAAHPGLTGITGVVYGRTPSVTPQAREAQALYDKIVARGGFSELQNMRAASPTGGALGNVSNVEGAQLKQAFAEIGREQATESVKKALLRAAENAKLVRQRAREAFEDTYEYRQSGGARPPAPAPAGGAVSVTLPDGRTVSFPSQAAADQFRRAAGL
jgi:hypothetical protein